MRILVLHPGDDPITYGSVHKWDLIVDLANGGPIFYEQCSQVSGCPAKSIARPDFSDFSRLASVFRTGTNCVLDDLGFDWWDLLSVRFYEPLRQVFTLRRFVESCPEGTQFFTTIGSFQSLVLKQLSPGSVQELPKSPVFSRYIRQTIQQALSLGPQKMLEVLQDKYDGSYQLRHLFLRPPARKSSKPVVLLPSAYANASRTALAYAGLVPDVNFLLVATRKNAWLQHSQGNVAQSHLAAYVSAKSHQAEVRRLVNSWELLRQEFGKHSELGILVKSGCFDSVPLLLRQGLNIRDAWFNVFESEPVSSVLCADEMNWFTRLPILVARMRGLPTVACHHGAFDVRYSFQNSSAERFLAKGFMESNYLVEQCKAPPEKITIAAPPRPFTLRPAHKLRDSIIFFSEPYEVFGGRCREFYREILPNLAQIAKRYRCKLVVKLHPYESRRERGLLISEIVGDSEFLQIVDGPLQNELLQRAWFAITISSSTVLDCALSQVPVFVCEWLETSGAKYSEQFIRFGAATGLGSAMAVRNIPPQLAAISPRSTKEFWDPVDPGIFRTLLFERAGNMGHEAKPAPLEQAWA